MLACEFITRFLESRELNHCFGLSGANIEDLIFEINSKKKSKLILAKTEYGASMMAIGYYLATKQISIVLTTSGAGLLNTIPVLAEAYSSNRPFVLISGLIPQALEGLGSFQDGSGNGKSINVLEIIKPITGYSQLIQSVEELPHALESAFRLAEKNKKPSAILIPKNIFMEELKNSELILNEFSKSIFNEEELQGFLSIAEAFSEQPLIVLGENIIHLKNLTNLKSVISKLDAKVAVTPNGKGFFDHNSPSFLGVTGVMGTDNFFDYAQNAKNIIFLGTEFDMLSRFGIDQNLEDKNIFVFNETKTAISNYFNSKKYLEINGDLEKILELLSLRLNSKKYINLTKSIEKENESFSFKNIVHQFASVIGKTENVLADAGNTGAFVIHDLELSGEGLFYVSLGMGGMGNSIGASIGCSVGNKKRSYAFMGDGSFLMYGLEIHTAVENEIPVTFVVFNNNSHAMCSTRENVFLGNETGVNNFKKSFLGKGMDQMFPGLRTFDVSNFEELQVCLKELPLIISPCLVSINISKDEEPPFRSFYKKLNNKR